MLHCLSQIIILMEEINIDFFFLAGLRACEVVNDLSHWRSTAWYCVNHSLVELRGPSQSWGLRITQLFRCIVPIWCGSWHCQLVQNVTMNIAILGQGIGLRNWLRWRSMGGGCWWVAMVVTHWWIETRSCQSWWMKRGCKWWRTFKKKGFMEWNFFSLSKAMKLFALVKGFVYVHWWLGHEIFWKNS